MFLIIVPYGILKNHRITESQFIIFLYQGFLCLVIAFLCELLCLEDVFEFSCFINLTEGAFLKQRALNLAGLQLLVAFKDDIAYLHLVLLIDIDIKNHHILICHVVTLHNSDFRILEAFVIEITLSEDLSAVNHVGSNLTTLHDAKFCLHIFTFRLLDTIIVDAADARACSKINTKVNLRTYDRVGSNRHPREKPVTPIAFHRICNLCSRNRYRLSDGETRETCQDIVLIAFYAFDSNTSYLTSPWGTCI